MKEVACKKEEYSKNTILIIYYEIFFKIFNLLHLSIFNRYFLFVNLHLAYYLIKEPIHLFLLNYVK